jgi:hypothetical protein
LLCAPAVAPINSASITAPPALISFTFRSPLSLSTH